MIDTTATAHKHHWPLYSPDHTSDYLDPMAESTPQPCTPSSSSHHSDLSQVEGAPVEPRLSVEIPNPWPVSRPANVRSRSNRLHTPLSTKAVAAAICTQSTRRTRFRSEGSGIVTPRASAYAVEQARSSPCTASSTPRTGTSPRSNQSDTVRRFLNKRRHERSCSAPERPAMSLHINTILPLRLPPSRLCTAYPSSPSSSSAAAIRRNESMASFVTSASDGSWHGDHGDQDPDAQLARAIGAMQLKDKLQHVDKAYGGEEDHCAHGHGPLQVSTYDYIDVDDDDDDDQHSHALPQSLGGADMPPTPTVLKQLDEYQMEMLRVRSEGLSKFGYDKDLQEQEALIAQHAGTLIGNMASRLFDIVPALRDEEQDLVSTSADTDWQTGRQRNDSLPSLMSSSGASSSASCSSPSSEQRSFHALPLIDDSKQDVSPRLQLVRDLPFNRPPSPCSSPPLSPAWNQPAWWRSFTTTAGDA